MTDEPRHDHQTPHGYAPEHDDPSAHAAEPWVTHPETAEEPIATEPELAHPEPATGSRIWPRVVGVLLLFVIVGGVWIWQNPGFVYMSMRWLMPGSAGPDSATAEVRTLDARVTRLEQGLPAGLSAITKRVDVLEARQPAGTDASPDVQPLLTRLDTLEARVAAVAIQPTVAATSPVATDQSAEVRSLAARLDTLERQRGGQTADAARIDALQAQVNALSAHNPPDLSGQLISVQHRLDELAASQSKLSGSSDRVARLNIAEMALTAGRPLGSIPNAPPALTRFTTAAPPTEAGLRLGFAAAAQQALQVSLPDTEGKPFFDRILARLQDFRLITVREGDHVVIGNSTAAVLAHARVLLDVGDLGGATRTVATLSGPPAEKMAPWLTDANALQAAREALASMAEGG